MNSNKKAPETASGAETIETKVSMILPEMHTINAAFGQDRTPLAANLMSISRMVSSLGADEDKLRRAGVAACLERQTRNMAEQVALLEGALADRYSHEKDRPLVVYLACPYSHPDLETREARFIRVSQAAGWLVNNGYGVISPISQGHPIAEYGGAKGDWQTWEAADLRMIEASDAVVVLNIPGVGASVGVRAEVSYALQHGIPVSIMSPIGNDYLFAINDEAALFVTTRMGILLPTNHGGAHA